MGPRHEDNGILLLTVVTLICGAIALLPALFEPTASMAAGGKPPVQLASQAQANPTPVRVVGTPFVPNTNPRER
jgi:hypothetical protein